MSTQEYRRSGWVTFAAIMMLAVGFGRIISGISYLGDSNDVNDFSNGVLGDNLWAWGIWDLIIAGLALYAGWSLLSRGAFGVIMAYIWAVVVIVQGFVGFRYAPWYSAAAITIAVLVLYGLSKESESTAEGM